MTVSTWAAPAPKPKPTPTPPPPKVATDTAMGSMKESSLGSMTVAQLRAEAGKRGLSIRRDGRYSARLS